MRSVTVTDISIKIITETNLGGKPQHSLVVPVFLKESMMEKLIFSPTVGNERQNPPCSISLVKLQLSSPSESW